MRFATVLVLLVACGSNEENLDASADATTGDAAPDVGPPRQCGNNAWATFGHDARRTSASDGCINGPLKPAWRYIPGSSADGGKALFYVYNAVAQSDAVLIGWAATGIPFGAMQALDRVSADGKLAWTFAPGFGDSSGGEWPSIGLGGVLYASDGLYWIDMATGTPAHSYGVDYWGDVATDDTEAYVTNKWFVDGPPLFVGGYDNAGKSLWTQNSYGKDRAADGDSVSALAIDGNTVYFAGNYTIATGPAPFVSGIYAFDRVTGTVKWSKPATPTSAISISNGAIYLTEKNGGTTVQVARKEADGEILWSVPGTPNPNAPALSGNLVINQAKDAIVARSAQDGSIVWLTPLVAATATLYGRDTWMAVAEGSGTVVVVTSQIHILSLDDGHEVWSGPAPGALGVIKCPIIVGKRLYLVDSASPSVFSGNAIVAVDGI